MAAIAKTYLPGSTTFVTIDGVKYAIKDLKYSIDPGLWDATNQNSLGWMEQGTSIYTAKISGTLVATIAQPLPVFHAGSVYPVVVTTFGQNALTGSFIIGAQEGTVDLKGGVTYSVEGTSQGACTGYLVPGDVVPVPSGS